jgi:ataxin-10
LEGNSENQQAVAELELQGSVDMPELAGLGLRVEMDQNTRRAKLCYYLMIAGLVN